jgi:hypothetical protein
MKYLLLALSFASLAACQDSGTDTDDNGLKTGYVAGYQLTCGFSWKPGNGIVVEKEFARDFLDGAIMCARKHPDRARRILGLASAEEAVVVREPSHQTEAAPEAAEPPKPVPEATGTPQKFESHTAHAKKPGRAPAKVVKKPASRPEPSKKTTRAPVKAKASVDTRRAPEKPPERPAKAPAKTKASVGTPKAPVKPKEAPVAANAPAKAKTPVNTEKPAPKSAVTSAPKTKTPSPATEGTTRRQNQQRKQISDYQRFMGQ